MTNQTRTAWAGDSILDFLRSHRKDLRAMGVRRIGLFGPFARRDQHLDSDMDFLFVMDNLNWKRWMRLWNFLEDNLGSPVDLVPEDCLRPELRSDVLAEVRYVKDLQA